MKTEIEILKEAIKKRNSPEKENVIKRHLKKLVEDETQSPYYSKYWKKQLELYEIAKREVELDI